MIRVDCDQPRPAMYQKRRCGSVFFVGWLQEDGSVTDDAGVSDVAGTV